MDIPKQAAAVHTALFQKWDNTEELRKYHPQFLALPLSRDFKNILWVALKLNWQPCRPEVTPESLKQYVTAHYPQLGDALTLVLESVADFSAYLEVFQGENDE